MNIANQNRRGLVFPGKQAIGHLIEDLREFCSMVLADRENNGFSNENTQGVVEFIKVLSEGKTQDYLFVIEVEKSDFNYSYKIVEK